MRGLIVLLAVFGAIFIVLAADASATDHSNQIEGQVNSGPQVGTAQKAIVAKPGDSTTLMSRKLISQYIDQQNLILSPAQLVYTETILTQETHNERLIIGEVVSFDLVKLESIIIQAETLSKSQQAAWQPWAELAGINA